MSIAAAAGALSQSIRDMLAEREARRMQAVLEAREAEQLRLQLAQEHRLAAGQRAEDEYRRGQVRTQQAGVLAGLLSPGEEVSEPQAETFRGTPYEALLQQHETLPSRTVGQTGISQSATGGRQYLTLRPTRQQQQEAGEREARRKISQLLKIGAPRQEVLAAKEEAGQDITAAMMNDPDAAHRRALELEGVRQKGALDLEGVQQKGALAQIAARARASSGTPEGMRALAALAARSGSMPEGTPTQRGDIMMTMAGDPALLTQYEQTRMEPIRAQAQIMLTALDDLLTADGALTQGARRIFGEWTPSSTRKMGLTRETVSANASLQQIIGQRAVDLIREMKAQSQTGATGFGQLNLKELELILAAATRLGQRIPHDTARQDLRMLRDKYAKIMMPSAAETGGPAIKVAPNTDALLDELLGGAQ